MWYTLYLKINMLYTDNIPCTTNLLHKTDIACTDKGING